MPSIWDLPDENGAPPPRGTQFASFTSTKVPILTPEEPPRVPAEWTRLLALLA
jgi:hypothetical protein